MDVIPESFQKALDFLHEHQQRHLELQIEIAEIPAPYCSEKARADFMAQLFRNFNLEVSIDSVGNVRAYRQGDRKDLIVIAAHLDAAFPDSTEFKVTRAGNKLQGPSVVDNSLGLMAMLSLVEAMAHAEIKTRCGFLFVATVGEEGPGDLRGVKALMSDRTVLDNVKGFIALDSQGHEHIGNQSLGSKRYRVVVQGIGGHSYLDFGTPNPVSAVAKIIHNIDKFVVPKKPITTFNVGVVSGGVSVNVIPKTAELEVDFRSEDSEELGKLENSLMTSVVDGVGSVNRGIGGSVQALSYQILLVGDRPCGHTIKDNALVRSAVKAGEQLGLKTSYKTGSSDANVPMSIGVPAIKLGAGGHGGWAPQ